MTWILVFITSNKKKMPKDIYLNIVKVILLYFDILIRRYFAYETDRQKHIGKTDEKCSREISTGSRRKQMYVYLPPAQAAGRTEEDQKVNQMVL